MLLLMMLLSFIDVLAVQDAEGLLEGLDLLLAAADAVLVYTTITHTYPPIHIYSI